MVTTVVLAVLEVIFDDTDNSYLSDEELDRPFRGQEIVVDDVIST